MDNRSPHSLISSNYGDTWAYGGQLVGPDGVVGYNSGYFRYCDNGVDRIDFICTEAHPRDVQTSIYHGYISNGMSFKSDGTVVDTNVFDRIWPVSRNFQPVFTNTTISPPGQTNYRCWNSDVQRYADGTVQCIIHARINQFASGGYPDTVDPDHAFFFCRYDNTNWTSTYLCQAGYKPMASPVPNDRARVKRKTGQCKVRFGSNGTLLPANFGAAEIIQEARSRPRTPAARLRIVLSKMKRRTSPAREAPSAARSAISRRRPLKRTSNKLATLLHAMSKTAATAASSVRKAGRRVPVTSSAAFTSAGAQLPSKMPGYCAA